MKRERQVDIVLTSAPLGHTFKTKRKPNGYVCVYIRGTGWKYEHRWVMEQLLGRDLRREEYVHHLNQRRDDNRPENLSLLDSRSHGQLHRRIDRAKAVALYASGLSASEVAELVGATPGFVGQLCRSAGVSRSMSAAAELRARRENGQFERKNVSAEVAA
jgi:hypothetical protein